MRTGLPKVDVRNLVVVLILLTSEELLQSRCARMAVSLPVQLPWLDLLDGGGVVVRGS